MAGVAFSVHSIVESMRTEQTHASNPWTQLHAPLREVPPAERRTAAR